MKYAFILLLSITALCSSESAQEFAKTFLDSTEVLRIVPLEADYSLVFIGGEPSFIVGLSENSSPFVVTDTGRIYSLVNGFSSSHSASYALPSSSQVEKLSGFVASFNRSRQPQEGECKQYIGIDVYPCSDMDSCLRSCYTPLCRGFSLNAGQGFIQAVLDYSKGLAKLDSEISEAMQAFPLLEGAGADQAYALLENLSLGMNGIDSAARNISSNPLLLYEIYYFCPSSKYDFSSLSQAQAEIAYLKGVLALSLKPAELAGQVASETPKRIEFKKNLEECADRTREEARLLAGFSSDSQNLQDFEEIQEALRKLARFSGEADAACKARDFKKFNSSHSLFTAAMENASSVLREIGSGVQELSGRLNESLNQVAGMANLGENVSELNFSLSQIKKDLNKATSLVELENVSARLSDFEASLGGSSHSGSPSYSPSAPSRPSSYSVRRPKKESINWLLVGAVAIAITAGAWFFLRKRRFRL